MDVNLRVLLAALLFLAGIHARSTPENMEVIKLCETLEPECVRKLDICAAIMTPDEKMEERLRLTALTCLLEVTGIDIKKAASLPRMGDLPKGPLKSIKSCVSKVMMEFLTAATAKEEEGVRNALLNSFEKCDMIGMRSCMLNECMEALPDAVNKQLE
ncbi:uncharacterized protein LOC134776569 [Penaeus indicus]|uniref:uncharacterized protein LOC134776569 n=1 Tax=Penaeus indicus TaxID=29960 RepID=UPI00300CCB3A